MKKIKLVFNNETGKYNLPVEMNETELAVYSRAIKNYTDGKNDAFNFASNHSGNMSDDELRQIRSINKKITDAANELASIGIEMNYKDHLL